MRSAWAVDCHSKYFAKLRNTYPSREQPVQRQVPGRHFLTEPQIMGSCHDMMLLGHRLHLRRPGATAGAARAARDLVACAAALLALACVAVLTRPAAAGITAGPLNVNSMSEPGRLCASLGSLGRQLGGGSGHSTSDYHTTGCARAFRAPCCPTHTMPTPQTSGRFVLRPRTSTPAACSPTPCGGAAVTMQRWAAV